MGLPFFCKSVLARSLSGVVAGACALFVLAHGGAYAASAPMMTTHGAFAVSPAGAATYSIPISVPPGTAGMVPALSLQYSSQNGDGIVGLGWALGGLPSITRCPRTLAQDGVHGGVNYDANDRFCMDGQRLMVVSGGYGANGSEYRTELESFTKVVAYGSSGSGPAWFKVWTKAGQIIEFGNSVDSQVKVVNTASGVTSSNTVRVWAANKISDAVGNYMTVIYNCAASSGSCTDTDRTVNGEVYPLRVDYTGNGAAGKAPYNSVQFSYSNRSDSTPLFQAGAKTQLTKILTNIKTYQAANLVMDYQLAYRAGTSALRSHLTSVTQCNGLSQCLPTTTFGWQGASSITISTENFSPAGGKLVIPGDWNGDGLTDQALVPDPFTQPCPPYPVYVGQQSFGFASSAYALTNGASSGFQWCNVYAPSGTMLGPDGTSSLLLHVIGGNDPPTPTPSPNRFINLMTTSGNIDLMVYNNGGTNAGDYNGDGIPDFLSSFSYPTIYPYYGNPDGTFTAGSAMTGLYPATLQTADFDGDGCTDIMALATSSNTVQYFCSPAISSSTPPAPTGYNQTLGDFNGDGKTDVLLTQSGYASELWLATGTGFEQVNASLTTSWATVGVGDWNGDGKADIAAGVTSGTDITLYLSTGTGFTPALDGSGNPVTISFNIGAARTVVADWNNDGASDILIQEGGGEFYALLNYTPELMVSVSNGIGASTQVIYDRINKGAPFYTKGSGAAYPIQDMIGPQYVVKSVDRSDGLGTCSTPGGANCYRLNYSYSGAKKDLQGRGFLGFAQVVISDPQTGIVETTNYSTTFPYVGLINSQTRIHGAVTLSSTANSYTNNSGCDIAPAGSGVYVNCLNQSVVAANDLNGAAFPTTTTNYTYDNYGNPLTVNVSLSDGSTKNTTNTYWKDASNWFIGRLLTTSVNSIVAGSNLTRQSSFAYSGTTGLLTQESIQPGTSTCNSGSSSCTLTTSYTYDAFGHRITTTVYGTGITTRTSYAVYDFAGQFQTAAINALGQYEFWTYNPAFGLPTTHTDLNALTTGWSYDGFGRPVSEIRPDGTRTLQSYAYCPGACPLYGQFYSSTAIRASDGTTQIGPTSTAYFDMLSRGIANDTQSFDDRTIRVATLYDSKGRVHQTSRPYYLGAPGAFWTTFAYDDLARVTQATFPDASQNTYGYNGMTTTVTNGLGQTTTTVKNAQGLNAGITDAASNTTSYLYDAFGNVTRVTDPAGNSIVNTYDIRGNKVRYQDPDMGLWTYAYDVLGQLNNQTDAKGQVTSLAYDLLGRALTRQEGGLYSAWTYGANPNARDVGQLIQARACPTSACASVISDRVSRFDGLGRPAQTVLQTQEGYFGYRMAYDATNGQLASVAYPSGFVVNRTYNDRGYLTRLSEPGGAPIWTMGARNAEQQLTSQTAGNGVVTTQTFDPLTGRLLTQRAGSVASFDYGFDVVGNLTVRSDNVEGYTERFCYDALNRLTDYNFGYACVGGKSVSYNAIGNITAKSDTGSYAYGIQPHAVAAITGTVDGQANPHYIYDANGNLLCVSSGAGCSGSIARNIVPTSFNMAGAMIQGANSLALTYDDQHQRIRQVNTVSGTATTTTLYLNDPATGAMSERVTQSGTTPTTWNSFDWNAAPWGGATANAMPTWTDYITVDGKIVAQRSVTYEQAAAWGFQDWNGFNWGPPPGNTWNGFNWGAADWSGPAVTWAYFNLDHLGSVAVITDQGGKVVQRLSYDAWGKQRYSSGEDATCGNVTPSTTRGFTNQEQMPTQCLVNFNARIYDPSIGRFMAADSVVPDAYNGQSYNRFSYVNNGPLSFTDPTGHSDETVVVTANAFPQPGLIGTGSLSLSAGSGEIGRVGMDSTPTAQTLTLPAFSYTSGGITKKNFNVSPPNTCSRAGGAGSDICSGLYPVIYQTVTWNSSGEASNAAGFASGDDTIPRAQGRTGQIPRYTLGREAAKALNEALVRSDRVYSTMDKAARAWGQIARQASEKYGWEFGAYIYKTQDGYRFAPAFSDARGYEVNMNLADYPKGAEVTGWIHTHPNNAGFTGNRGDFGWTVGKIGLPGISKGFTAYAVQPDGTIGWQAGTPHTQQWRVE